MKRLLINSILGGALAASLLTINTPIFAAKVAGPTPAKMHQLVIKLNGISTPTNLEFVETAKSGTLSPVAGQDGIYKLTLTGASSYLSYFSDRPKRVTGIIPTEHFMKVWSTGTNNFLKNPPNADLESLSLQSDNQLNYIFELSNPVYDAKLNTISFTAKVLNNQKIADKAVDLGYTTLFIDGLTDWNGNNA